MASNPRAPNYHPLTRHVARALRSRCGVGAGASVVVGCSGGADSVALVRALALLAGRRRWRLNVVVGHVQHHLRGEAAEADAAFVGRLATDLGLGFERRDVFPEKEGGNLEAAARRLRYRALVSVALQRGAGFVATAHHADDQLETVLMRLLRGASYDGLRGIAWRRRLRTPNRSEKVFAVRPMLGVERVGVLDFLESLQQPWCEDATNRDTTRTRARLRHEIIPLLKQVRGDAAGKAVALSDHLNDLHDLVRDHIQEATMSSTLDELPRDQARGLNKIVLMQMLRTDLIRAGVRADQLPGHALHPVIEAVRDDAGGVRSFDFAGGVRIKVSSKSIRVIRR